MARLGYTPSKSLKFSTSLLAITAGFGIFAGTASTSVPAEEKPATPPAAEPTTLSDIAKECVAHLNTLPGKVKASDLEKACRDAQVIEGCTSVQGTKIFHVDRIATKPDAKKVLVIGLIHGDELPSGSLVRDWMIRLTDLDPRNSWRIIPVLNPDGVAKKTRINANGVDLNRNFPTQDWAELALKHWEQKFKKDPRRYPGAKAGSEPETRCALSEIDQFAPDFIASVHTPYGVLDFDGPSLGFPTVASLPWKSLGTFPGSLGRFMWNDKQIPVLTVELKNGGLVTKKESVERLQDIIGRITIDTAAAAKRAEKAKTAPATEKN